MDITSIGQVLAVIPEAKIALTVIAFLMLSATAMKRGDLVAVTLAESFDVLLGREVERSLEAQFVAITRLLIFGAIAVSFLIVAF